MLKQFSKKGTHQHLHVDVRFTAVTGNEQPGLLCRWSRGSPSHRYGLSALQWIIEVNDQRTPDLGSFIEVVKVCIVSTEDNILLRIFQYLRFLTV
jgi:hypothetical protein